MVNKLKNHLDTKESIQPKIAEKTDKGPDLSAVKEIRGGIMEGIDIGESDETLTMGNVSETSESAKDSDSGSAGNKGSGTQQDDQVQSIIEKLKKSNPPQIQMVREITHALMKQEKILLKEVKIHIKSNSYSSLNEVIAKLRKLRELLQELTYATYEAIKNMWLKLVHDIH